MMTQWVKQDPTLYISVLIDNGTKCFTMVIAVTGRRWNVIGGVKTKLKFSYIDKKK